MEIEAPPSALRYFNAGSYRRKGRQADEPVTELVLAIKYNVQFNPVVPAFQDYCRLFVAYNYCMYSFIIIGKLVTVQKRYPFSICSSTTLRPILFEIVSR